MFGGLAARMAGVPLRLGGDRCGGNSEVFENGVTGLLVAPDDPQALATAILRYVRDTAFRRRVAEAARDHVESRYGWDDCVAAHETIYDKD